MKERPIIFSGSMVRAILDGRKTQTRRIVLGVDECAHGYDVVRRVTKQEDHHLFDLASGQSVTKRCPYGAPGDRLWVRETHAGDTLCGWVYRADHPTADISAGELDDGEQSLRRWTPAIHMIREACRLVLEVTGARVERLHDISEADAKREGIDAPTAGSHRGGYAILWNSLNLKRGHSWASNPWVWVIDFRTAA